MVHLTVDWNVTNKSNRFVRLKLALKVWPVNARSTWEGHREEVVLISKFKFLQKIMREECIHKKISKIKRPRPNPL